MAPTWSLQFTQITVRRQPEICAAFAQLPLAPVG